MDVFCLNGEAWNCVWELRVSSYRCCMFVSRGHPVAVLTAAFCITF